MKKKGCAVVFLFYGLVMLALALKFVSDSPSMADSETPSPAARVAAVVNAASPRASEPTVAVLALSGAAIRFRAQNGEAVDGVPAQMQDLPRLVLRRNGALTDPTERTLVVEVTGIEVPPPGVTVTLAVETQHGDPDLGGGPGNRIMVWRESRWIANGSGATQTGGSTVFALEFGEVVASGGRTIGTPTDYFRYEVTVSGAPASPALGQTLSRDYGFLMENEWAARLPGVQETSAGAAPDELIVYYCDMFPFQKDGEDPATGLPRETVTNYVHAELGPRLVEAFRVESDGWGFPWHDAWTSYRSGEETGRLSVALSDGETWFHGRAPNKGHAEISIRVAGGPNVWYDTLTDGIMNTFYHELFHNLQRNISQMSGGDGDVDGAGDAWQFFSEGTAELASSVGQPTVQFAQSSRPRAYIFDANGYMGGDGYLGDLNTSYTRMRPYHAAPYWRFLYEQCGGMTDGVENPAAGMHVIRRALAVLYSGEIVDIGSSSDLALALPRVMDRALEGSACPFRTYEESLAAFARAVYALGLDGGRCTAAGIPAGCSFYDPNNLYRDPPVETITYAGTPVTHAAAEQVFPAGIKSSFGIDFVDVILDPTANGQPLTIEFYGAPGSGAAFNVQLWKLVDRGGGARPQRVPNQAVATEVPTATNADGHLLYTIPAIDTAAYNRLGLIITRVDGNEGGDPVGAYSLVLQGG